MTVKIPQQIAGRRRAVHTSARALGWFSIALGLTELLASRAVARAAGLQGREGLVMAFGLREIATGIGLLAARDPTPWVWARVAGDAMDLAALGSGIGNAQGLHKACAIGSTLAVAGVTMADVATAQVLGEIDVKDRTDWRDYSDRSGFPKPGRRIRAGSPEPVQPGAIA